LQGLGVGGEVDADDVGFLVHYVVDEPRILVTEAVVVMAPDVGGEQVVEGGRWDGAWGWWTSSGSLPATKWER